MLGKTIGPPQAGGPWPVLIGPPSVCLLHSLPCFPMGSQHPPLRIASAQARVLSFPMADGTRGNASNHALEPGPPAMPRLPSCCPQHSPCSVSSQNQHVLGPPPASCFQQHSHHFQHHHHHHSPHAGVPLSPPFSDSSCPVDRPPPVPAPGGPSSSAGTAFHDQASWEGGPLARSLWLAVSFRCSGQPLASIFQAGIRCSPP